MARITKASAFHEAGHAVAAMMNGMLIEVKVQPGRQNEERTVSSMEWRYNPLLNPRGDAIVSLASPYAQSRAMPQGFMKAIVNGGWGDVLTAERHVVAAWLPSFGKRRSYLNAQVEDQERY